MAPRRLLLAVLAYGALNAILYAGLLPLWDGFDEPFHHTDRHILHKVAEPTPNPLAR